MKKLVLITGPFNTRSGYGDHARSIFYALNNAKKYDIKLHDVRWGDTPRNYLNPKNSDHKALLDCILIGFELEKQPDIYIDVRIPNEFETHGKFNVGITAGIETTAISSKWIQGCNKMDLIIVPSKHSRDSIVNTVYDAYENLPDGTQKKAGNLKVEKPVEVVFEGMDTSIFKPLNVRDVDRSILKLINNTIKEDFAFLFVGQWVKGGYGEDRKDIGRLIKVFCETFTNKSKQPALILKTSGATLSFIDKQDILTKINHVKSKFPRRWKLPPIYLLHGDLTDNEMNHLYNHPKIKCMVSFTHGEGFGRPFLEASLVGLPVIASGWSGQVDFLDPENTIFIEGELQQVPAAAVWEDIVIPESQWFVIDEHKAYLALKFVVENKYSVKNNAKKMMYKNIKLYSLDKMTKLFNKILDKYTSDLATSIPLNLPKLKKINKDNNLESIKIKLPKLKKVT